MSLPKQTHKPKLEVVTNPRTEKKITPKQEEFAKRLAEFIDNPQASATHLVLGLNLEQRQ